MPVEIPKQLKNLSFRFVLLQKSNLWGNKKLNKKLVIPASEYDTYKKDKDWTQLGKVPYEKAWQENGYKYNDIKLISHTHNYGVIGGYGNLRIIDIDDPKLVESLLKKVDTFTVRTGSGGVHIYVLSDYNTNHVFKDAKGELRASNYQVVGANCTHPNGNKYEIINNSKVATLTKEEMTKLLKPLLISSKQEHEEQVSVDSDFIETRILPKLGGDTQNLITNALTKQQIKDLGYGSRSERDQKVITTLLLNGFGQYIHSVFRLYPVGDKSREHGAGEAYLTHSIKNSRGFTGIQDDRLPSLENEIESTHPRVLRNKLDTYLNKIAELNDKVFKRYLITLLAYKIKINKIELGQRLAELIMEKEEQVPVSMTDLLAKDLPRIEYWVEPFLPKSSLIVLGGKPGEFKSMFALFVAVCMRKGELFLDKFNVPETPKILLYDLENGERVIQERLQYLIKGLNINAKQLTNFHLVNKFNKHNVQKEVEFAKNYDIIILDSYRRFLEGSENDSETTDKFYKEYLGAVKDMGKTLIVLHHLKKGSTKGLDEQELMDLFRGSGDIPAQCDIVLSASTSSEAQKINSTGITFETTIEKVKNRLGLQIRDFTFRVDKDDDNRKTTCTFVSFSKKRKPKDIVKDRIIELIKEKKTLSKTIIVDTIKNETGSSDSGIAKYLAEMINDNVLSNPTYGVYTVVGEATPI